MNLFLLGVIVGLIGAQYLPPDLVQYIENNMKIKKSTVTDTTISQTNKPKEKRGLLKRIFKRKKV